MVRTNEQRTLALQAFTDRLLEIRFKHDKPIPLGEFNGLSYNVSVAKDSDSYFSFGASWKLDFLPLKNNKSQCLNYSLNVHAGKPRGLYFFYAPGNEHSEGIIQHLVDIVNIDKLDAEKLAIVDGLIDTFGHKFIPEKMIEIFGEDKSLRAKAKQLSNDEIKRYLLGME